MLNPVSIGILKFRLKQLLLIECASARPKGSTGSPVILALCCVPNSDRERTPKHDSTSATKPNRVAPNSRRARTPWTAL